MKKAYSYAGVPSGALPLYLAKALTIS